MFGATLRLRSARSQNHCLLLSVCAGWPIPPARQPGCTLCPAGWASSAVNSSTCTMCPPGTAAPHPQSTSCAPCAPGTYAYSWGSTHCKHCIAGTFASEGECVLAPRGRVQMQRLASTPGLDMSLRARLYARPDAAPHQPTHACAACCPRLAESSALCRMCPANTTSGKDGAAACENFSGGTDLSRR